MLVLSRKPGESIRIGDDIKVTVVKIRGNRVRVGIEAPDGIHIVRGELNDWQELSFDLHAVVDMPGNSATSCCDLHSSL